MWNKITFMKNLKFERAVSDEICERLKVCTLDETQDDG